MNQERAETGTILAKFDPTHGYSEAELESSKRGPNMQ
jgi:hypothetical protein